MREHSLAFRVNISTTSLFARAGSAAPSRNEPQPLAAGVGAEGRDDDDDEACAEVQAQGSALNPTGSRRLLLLPPPPPPATPAHASHAVLGLSRAGGVRDGEVGLAGLEVDSGVMQVARALEAVQFTLTSASAGGRARVRCGVRRARRHREVLVRWTRQFNAASRLAQRRSGWEVSSVK
ncbi:hypothetical protein DFH08DRAFT_866545 [Mycena albidolilacea]|uniref:Uncharacterized protein n=1 Tax=Mycena albidolilacea TaxID=1033008 RepID=A0AAD7EQV8_9AGAR|nr:hypothetical protein DFH08DRAFT_866545 [Mycena albidolilacea]